MNPKAPIYSPNKSARVSEVQQQKTVSRYVWKRGSFTGAIASDDEREQNLI